MKYTVECPTCASETEVSGRAQAEAGVKCAGCGIDFVPAFMRPETSYEEEPEKIEAQKEEERLQEFRDLKSKAEGVGLMANVLFAIAIIALVLAAVTGDGQIRVVCMVGGGSAFSLSLVLFIVSHLIHIRAALEKLANKN